jgi:hypothetical protein
MRGDLVSPLEQLRATQRDDVVLDADAALDDFLHGCTPETAQADLEPTTDIERRHLAYVRRHA